MAPSSPHLPSMFSSRTVGIEPLISKKANRGLDLDDSSSFASMSSTSRAKLLCQVCKKKASFMSQLVPCGQCAAHFHEGCPNPIISNSKEPYTCRGCLSKSSQAVNRTSTTKLGTTTESKLAASKQGKTHVRAVCDAPRCDKPPVCNIRSRSWCFQHKIEMQHKSAAAQQAKPSSNPRPIQKQKLHPLKPDDKPLLKRKRPTLPGRQSANSAGPAMDLDMAAGSWLKDTNKVVNAAYAPTKPAQKTSQMPDIKRGASTVARKQGSVRPSIVARTVLTPETYMKKLGITDNIPLAQASPEYEPPPATIEDLAADIPSPRLHAVAPDARIEKTSTGSKPPSRVALLTGVPHLSLNITSGTVASAILEPHQSAEDEGLLDDDTLAYMNKIASQHSDSPVRRTSQPSSPMSPLSPMSSGYSPIPWDSPRPEPDTEMLIDPPEPEMEEIYENAAHSGKVNTTVGVMVPKKPAHFGESSLDLLLQKQLSPKEPVVEEEIETTATGGGLISLGEQASVVAPEPEEAEETEEPVPNKESNAPVSGTASGKAKEYDGSSLGSFLRKQSSRKTSPEPNKSDSKPTTSPVPFDESTLDFFLQKQATRDPDHEPSAKELLETQVWGSIDPRVVWPKPFTEAEREAKMFAIAARGNRKSKENFGKIITPAIRKERVENGWDIAQSSDIRDDEVTRTATKHLEELFGIQGMGNCVPRTVDGRLVMQERPKPPHPRKAGRQPKEVPPRVWVVQGNQ